ncbi:phospholipase A2 A2-actitoxin-Ucs2a isoform X2 [Exaiptasia diaphana]|uniref:Phospholipase A2 n=1 Tax=Exaiptasia diaphana TaxID=2652724 RepID=A0A913XDC1_EXADI|nr:phospholipase A2 A2-actitoxin-Ucs2a isoform X2 [Exaiptasia diaphana]
MKRSLMFIAFLGVAFLCQDVVGRYIDDEVDEDQDWEVPLNRQKRNLWQFKNMIKCATDRSAWDYNGYGNWCGAGGSGTPVDGVDRCCKAHDQCYDRNQKCNPKWNSYKYSRSGKGASCRITCHNYPKNDRCELNVCYCDKIAAECFRRHPYNKKHKN